MGRTPPPRPPRDVRLVGPIRARGAAPPHSSPHQLKKGRAGRAGQCAAPGGVCGCVAAGCSVGSGSRCPRAQLPDAARGGGASAARPDGARSPTRRCWSERGDGRMLALLAAGVALAVAAAAQDVPAPGSRFVCTALPPEAVRAGCPLPAMPMQGGSLSPEEELRAAVLQLRETVVQQKETLGAQSEAIRELTGKLARCEGLAGGKAPGRGAAGKDTMGDLPRDPGHVVEQLSRSLQTLKDRLESLEVAGRGGPGGGVRGPAREAVRECAGFGAGSRGSSRSCLGLSCV